MRYELEFPIDQLQEAAYNPRTMTAAARQGLQASMRDNGLLTPIIANERTGYRIIGGHQRVAAARAEGRATVPAVIVDISEAEEKKLNLLLNSERARGNFLSEPLRELLVELQEQPGFTEMRFDLLLADYQIDTLEDDFKGEPVPGEERHEGMELDEDKDAEADDDTKYLRLHYTMDQAAEVEEKLGAYMKERQIPSMTEAVLQLLHEI